MKEKPTLAVFIPTYRRPAQLARLLAALEAQTRLPDQIIVAARDGDQATISALAEWAGSSPLAPRHSVVGVQVAGHLPPILAGVEVCSCDVFCQIDDDAIPAGDWLQRLEEDFLDPAVGGVGGKVLNHLQPDAEPEVLEPGTLSWFGRSGPCCATKGDLPEARCPLGGNMAYRTEALSGAVDLALNGGSAVSYETDVALNVRAKGYRFLYDPRVVIDHYPAPRHIDVARGWNAEECFVYGHNLTYICLKHLKWYGKAGFFVYFFLGGTWGCPGVATYLLSLCRGGALTFSGHLVPAMRGRVAGIRSFLQRNGDAGGANRQGER
jgi:glycosyltransferase involved in cell wall biosynthesis